MADAAELLKIIKKAVADMIGSMKLSDMCFGEVVSAAPIKILVDQKLALGERQLILTRNVTDYKVKITGGNVRDFYFSGELPGAAAEPVSPPHVHAVGTLEITVHNALKTGDRVILLRQQGGQKYLVVDRI